MNDDFNTRQALAGMYDLVREINSISAERPEQARKLVGELKAMAGILGILQDEPESFLHAGAADTISAEEIERLVAERAEIGRASCRERVERTEAGVAVVTVA